MNLYVHPPFQIYIPFILLVGRVHSYTYFQSVKEKIDQIFYCCMHSIQDISFIFTLQYVNIQVQSLLCSH